MSKFLTPLYSHLLLNKYGMPHRSRMGNQLFKLDSKFEYESDISGETIGVPKDFVTDFSSIPRLPFIYLFLNGYSDMAGVIHDYLYSVGKYPRKLADQVLREACLVIGIPKWKAEMIYCGVRVGGASRYMLGEDDTDV